MILEPFPATFEWYASRADDIARDAFHEYWYAVHYHMSNADQAMAECSATLRRFSWTLTNDWSTAFIDRLEPIELIRSGDTAIREALSAIETGLHLTNHVARTHVNPRYVRWGARGKDEPLRSALGKHHGNLAKPLEAAIDSVFHSIGYELLAAYRHWATHRGAPRILRAPSILDAITIPEVVHNAARAQQSTWHIEGYLSGAVQLAIEVQCWPFVPPIVQEIDDLLETETGYVINRSIHFVGEMTDEAASYKQRNQTLLERNLTAIAGEQLATYLGAHYLFAVMQVVHFVHGVLRHQSHWDKELVAFCI